VKELYREGYENRNFDVTYLNKVLNRYDIGTIRKDIKTDATEAVKNLGQVIDSILPYVFPKDKNEPENFTRGFNFRCGPKGQYIKDKISYKIKSGEEMEKVIIMPIEEFLRYSGREDLLEKGNIIFNPHGAYKPKAYAKNPYKTEKIHVRVKTPKSMAHKVIKYLNDEEKEGEKIPDLIGIRIILNERSQNEDCYLLNKDLKEELFTNYHVVEEEDNIKNIKPSGYQTLKTVFNDGSCFELQVRTKAMHDEAMRDLYNKTKFQNGPENVFLLAVLENIFSFQYRL